MSTETTFYEDDKEDMFINRDLLTNEITMYRGGCHFDSIIIPPEAIVAMYTHLVEVVMKKTKEAGI
jgi:hypothetical protein